MTAMPEREAPHPPECDAGRTRFGDAVQRRESLKLRAREGKFRSVWAGFGFFGLVGWSIVVPTLAGVFLGRWLDRTHPGERSWTLIFLVAGLSLGCLNAWRWIAGVHRELDRELHKDTNSPSQEPRPHE